MWLIIFHSKIAGITSVWRFPALPLQCHTRLTLVANETTFLTWFRFSMSLSSIGVVIAQTARIQHIVHPEREHEIKYSVLGVPQAAACQGAAIVVILIGAYRFFRQEKAMIRRKARIGGWELHLFFAVILAMLATFFCFVFFVDIINIPKYFD
jgi:uncharacterized membrane protein YidH (DUF202 family)